MYMVERILPEATLDYVEAIRHSAEVTCRELATKGCSVRYVRSIFTTGESRCRCLFEAHSADLVRELNDAAQLPYNRILLALDLPGGLALDRRPSGKPQSCDPTDPDRHSSPSVPADPVKHPASPVTSAHPDEDG